MRAAAIAQRTLAPKTPQQKRGGRESRTSGADDPDFHAFHGESDYLSLSDASATSDKMMATIQNRIVTFDSGQPRSSKW